MKEFARVLRAKLRDDMNRISDDVSVGACKSFDEYRHLCGQIHGLALAERHLMDLLDNLQQDEDE